MKPPVLELTFHRSDNATQPEAFRFKPQVYRRLEADTPVGEAELPWSDELLRLLGRLSCDAGDTDARLRVGATLRRFLEQLGWRVPEERLAGDLAAGGGPILLTVRSMAAELYALPWELVTLPVRNQHLADLPHVVVRYAWPGVAPILVEDRRAEAAPARVVFAWSAAGGAIPARPHRKAIAESVGRARGSGARLHVVADVTERALEDALAADGPAALHLLCHGVIRKTEAGTAAALRWHADGTTGEASDIDAHRLATLLSRARSRLRLVVLCACHSGDAGLDGLCLGSLAQAIHRAGVPAVVASRYPFSAAGSIRLTRVLYDALLARGVSLEVALQRARAALHSPNGWAEPDGTCDDFGRHSEDAYALQLYTACTERVPTGDGSVAERPLTATYPFGRAGVSSPSARPAPPSPGRAPRVRAFIAYAREDAPLRKAFEQHLWQLGRWGSIEAWYDREIGVGHEWAGQVSADMETAQVILLLLSPNFVSSDYCADVEVARALARHDAGEAVVIPVILRPCAWEWAPFAHLQALPRDGRPVRSWSDADEAWTEVGRGLEAAIQRLAARRAAAPAPGGAWAGPALPSAGPVVGREALVSEIAAALLRDPAPRVPILGAAGIGKTTVSLAALHRPDVAARYGRRRYFVRLEAAPDAEAAAAAIAAALRIEPARDLRGRALAELAREPAALVLDNLETPWDRDGAGTDALLAEVAALPGVALVASIRGAAHPCGVTWTRPVRLSPLGEGDAIEVFCAIAGEEHRRALLLLPLLAKQEGVPLAITLLAQAAQGNDLANLAEEWEERRTALLQRGGAPPGRLTSWAASLELSLESQRMTGEARRLAALLGVLPDGVAQQDLRALLPGAGPGAARVLAQLELAYFEGGRLRMLAPVREHVASAHIASAADIHRAMNHYGALAQTLGPKPGTPGGAEAAARLAPEVANLDAMIRRGLEGEAPERWIDAAVALKDFARFSGHASPALLVQALEAACAAWDRRREAQCRWSLGEIALHRLQHEEARRNYEQALPLFRNVGDILRETICIKRLGDVALEARMYEEALSRYEQALPLFRQIEDVLGEANCIRSLGDIALERSQHDQARVRYEQALLLFRHVGSPLGEANCTWSLGEMALEQSHHDEAQGYYQKALPLFQQVGDVLGEANCVLRLGEVARAHGDFTNARSRFEQALALYTRIRDPYSIGQTHRRLARLATEVHDRRRQVEAARTAWLGIDRRDLVAELDSEFAADTPAP